MIPLKRSFLAGIRADRLLLRLVSPTTPNAAASRQLAQPKRAVQLSLAPQRPAANVAEQRQVQPERRSTPPPVERKEAKDAKKAKTKTTRDEKQEKEKKQ